MNKSISLFSLTSILLVFTGLLIVVIKAAPSETGESASSKPLALKATISTPRPAPPDPAPATPVDQNYMPVILAMNITPTATPATSTPRIGP